MNILVIDDEDNIREIISDILTDENHNVMVAEDGIKGLDIISKNKIDLCFLDVWMPNMGGIEVLKKIKENYPDIQVVMISGHAKIDLAVSATKIGAYDFLEKPLTMEKLLGLVKSIERNRRNPQLNKVIESDSMIGNSPQMKAIKELIESASQSDARILILGENGTGKELVAREIHNKSLRKNGPFIAVNCAAIPENLIEAELFGYVKGAFTGAVSDRVGKFELADKGTLFLDEVADMSLSTQAKVLRVLQEMKITRIGDTKEREINVRIIAATNKDIKDEIKKGNFREDLFYRLNVIPFYIPPLREREDDIPILLDYYLEKISKANNIEKKVFNEEALNYLKKYPWPGNIRQLRNIVERIMIMVDKKEILLEDIKKYLDNEDIILKTTENTKYDDYKLNTAIDEFEKDFIERKLKENDYNITKTAKALGIYPSNLHFKIHKLGINIKSNKDK